MELRLFIRLSPVRAERSFIDRQKAAEPRQTYIFLFS
jgi:hypothetical protein